MDSAKSIKRNSFSCGRNALLSGKCRSRSLGDETGIDL